MMLLASIILRTLVKSSIAFFLVLNSNTFILHKRDIKNARLINLSSIINELVVMHTHAFNSFWQTATLQSLISNEA